MNAPLVPTIVYADSLTEQQSHAAAVAVEASDMLVVVRDMKLATKDQYESLGAIVKEVQGKFKFLDEERKISVTPLNAEVDRINDWYRPALNSLQSIVAAGKRLMADFVLAQQRIERALLEEAQKKAAAVLATNPDPTSAVVQETAALVQGAAKTVPPKVTGLTPKPAWVWKITDAASLPRAFLMPDEKKIAKWVAEHGDKDVPSGVEVAPDVKITLR